MKVATRLRILLWWARCKRFLPYVTALLGAALGALVMRKRTAPVDRHRERDNAIIADAVRPKVAARVEAAKAAAKADVDAARAAHDKALRDAAKVHTATPAELDTLLKRYARNVRKGAQLVVLGWALSAGGAQAQAEPSCDETQCVLPIDVARAMLADVSLVDGLKLEIGKLTAANEKLNDALAAQGVAVELDDLALDALSSDLAAARAREAALKSKVDAWYRRPWVLLVTGAVVGLAAGVAVAL